jgi:hypothetical protein
MRRFFLVLPFCVSIGCTGDGVFSRRDVPKIDGYAATIPKSNLPKAELENAARVDQVGRKLLAASGDAQWNPLFMTIGSDTEAVFHQGQNQIYITEGLVKRCATDEELASVLAAEMGAMRVEKRASMPEVARSRREPPPMPRLTPDVAGSSMAPDMTRLAELADFEKRNGKRYPERDLPQETPDQLATDLMLQAGYPQEAYRKACPLIRQAQNNADREKHKWGLRPE